MLLWPAKNSVIAVRPCMHSRVVAVGNEAVAVGNDSIVIGSGVATDFRNTSMVTFQWLKPPFLMREEGREGGRKTKHG